jgi:hypothetical protein
MRSGHHITSSTSTHTDSLSRSSTSTSSTSTHPCLLIGCSASMSSCSQPVHHRESEEKGQLQSRQSALSFRKLRHRQELSLSPRSRQIGSRTLQQTTSSSSRDLLMQPVVSSGLQQLADMPLLNTELCSVTPRPIFCQFSSSSACISSVSETIVVFS